MAKIESGADDRPGTLALRERAAAEHCRGSIHDFHETVATVVALQLLVAAKRVFKTPRYKDLFSTHRRDECMFLGLGSLMVEVLHMLSLS
ncbi:MAG: hypothetical protein P8O70_05055 [SAR324 cluster bacterium]|nr:hypothetical protein [SAR324 cluster bacterium]